MKIACSKTIGRCIINHRSEWSVVVVFKFGQSWTWASFPRSAFPIMTSIPAIEENWNFVDQPKQQSAPWNVLFAGSKPQQGIQRNKFSNWLAQSHQSKMQLPAVAQTQATTSAKQVPAASHSSSMLHASAPPLVADPRGS